jgi:hypothetical protein
MFEEGNKWREITRKREKRRKKKDNKKPKNGNDFFTHLWQAHLW